MILTKKSKILLFMGVIVFISSHVFAQNYKGLLLAYKKKDTVLLQESILTYQYKRVRNNQDPKLESNVNDLSSCFYDFYLKRSGSTLSKTKYVVLQPSILISEVNEINFGQIKDAKRDNFIQLRPQTFGFYNFQPLLSLQNYDYKLTPDINNRQYKPLIVDENLGIDLNHFLRWNNGEYFKENKKKEEFLSNSILIFNDGDPNEGYFDYYYYIERLVFDKSHNKAVVQYTFFRGNAEAMFEKKNGKWELVENWILSQI